MSSLAFLFLFLTAPFFAYRFTATGANVTAFRVALFLAIAAVLLDHFNRTRAGAISDARSSAPLLVPLWLFVLYGVFQATRSEYDIGIRNLMVIIEGALAVTVIVWYVRNAEQLWGLIAAHAGGAALPAIIGIYQVYGVLTTNTIPPLPLTGWLSPWLVPYDPDMYGGIHLHVIEGLIFPRVASTLVDANFFGIYIACVVLCVLGMTLGQLLASHRRILPIVLGTGAIAVGLVALLFTMSRSAWIGFGVGGVYLAYHATRLHAETTRIRVALALVVAACGALIWQVLVITGLDLPILAVSRAQDVTAGLATRYDFAAGALEAFSKNPVFGVGLANLIAYTGYPTAHSCYLTLLGEDGLVGLALALAWLLLTWNRGAGLLASGVDPGIRWAATGLRSALLALLAANLAYDHLMSTEVNWVMLGLAAAMGRVTAPVHQPDGAPPVPSSPDTT